MITRSHADAKHSHASSLSRRRPITLPPRQAGDRFETAIRAGLDNLHAVHMVRGRGLLLGVVFRASSMAQLTAEAVDQAPSTAAADGIVTPAPPAILLIHVYLLRVHGVRTRPSGVDATTLLVEPPAVASIASVERVRDALREVAGLLMRKAFGVLLACWLSCNVPVPSEAEQRTALEEQPMQPNEEQQDHLTSVGGSVEDELQQKSPVMPNPAVYRI